MSPIDHAVRAALYARVSSDKQKNAQTIASQVAAVRERIACDGLTVTEDQCFRDDGVSGSTLVRPALERLRDAAARGEIDRLYIYEPDRLARQYAHVCVLLEEFQHAGADVVFLHDSPGTTPEDQLLRQVQGMIAEYERAKILERCRRGKRHAARQGAVSGLSGAAPYGYRYVGKQEGGGAARYEIVPAEARVVRQIFDWVGRERVSLNEVCRRLNQQGIRTRRGFRWGRTTVWNLLRNPAYQGRAAFGKRQRRPRPARLRPRRGQPAQPRSPRTVPWTAPESWVSIPVPALVSAELFAAVQEQLAENRQRARQQARGARYLLQGLVVCRHCGHALCGTALGGRAGGRLTKRQYTYYRCLGSEAWRWDGQVRCATRAVRTESLESAVWDDVCALLRDPGRVEAEYQRRRQPAAATDPTTAGSALAERLPHVQRGLDRLIDAYSEGLLKKSEFEPRLRAGRERLARLQAEVAAAAAAEAEVEELRLVLDHLQEFAERVQSGLAAADWGSRRDIVRALVKRVEVDNDAVRIVYRVNPVPFVERPNGGVLHDCSWRLAGRLGALPPANLTAAPTLPTGCRRIAHGHLASSTVYGGGVNETKRPGHPGSTRATDGPTVA